MRAIPFALTFAFAAGTIGTAFQAPRPAAEVLASAESAAAGQHKSILLIFHASW